MTRFLELKESFLTYLVHNKGRSPRTSEAYGLALDRLAAFADSLARDPLKLTADELVVFAGVWLHKQGVEARARRPYVAAVRTFFRWCAASRHLVADPAIALPYPRAGTRLPTLITLENAEKLMWAPDFTTLEGVRDAAILAILAGAGLRASGIVRLNESNLISDNVDAKPRLFLRIIEKGNKERRVPLPHEADLLLRMYLDHHALKAIDRNLEGGDRVLFVSLGNQRVARHDYHGEKRRLSRRSIFKIVRRYGKQAGIPEEQQHPHALRHLYGTELAEEGVDIIVRQRLMGHASPSSTEIYDHTAMRKQARAVDQANPLAKMRTPVTDVLARLRDAAGGPRRGGDGTGG